MPNFRKNPEFHYANKTLYSSVQPAVSATQTLPPPPLPPAAATQPQTAVNAPSLLMAAPTITIKVRAETDQDFIEMDIDSMNTSFDEFKATCLGEMERFEQSGLVVDRVRKLPNVLIRNTRDVKRLRDGQEIEFVFK